jgi:hypothetical protein
VAVVTKESARIRFACSACEHVIRVPTSHTGRRGKCPRCKGLVRVPGALRKPDCDETEALDMGAAWIAAEAIESRSGRNAVRASGSGSAANRKGTTAGRPRVDENELALAAARARVLERSQALASAADLTVVGGLLTMIAAALWFFAGLAADVIFVYAPVMFGAGAIALAKGLVAPPRGNAIQT